MTKYQHKHGLNDCTGDVHTSYDTLGDVQAAYFFGYDMLQGFLAKNDPHS